MLLGSSQCSAQLRGNNSPSPTGGHAPDFFEIMGGFFVFLLSLTVFNLIMWKVFGRNQAATNDVWIFARNYHLMISRIMMYFIPLPTSYVKSRVGQQKLNISADEDPAAANLMNGRRPVVVETELRWIFRYVPMFAPLETLGLFLYQVIYYFIGLFLCSIIFSLAMIVYIVESSLILILILPFKYSRDPVITWAEMFTFPDANSYLVKVRENLSDVDKGSFIGKVFCYFYTEVTN